MGIPKFFKWMSERYPLCSQLIESNSIPEFDNLYLDMNGIIHNSTHKGDHGIAGSLSEEKMFLAIFNYIEHLFATIQPKKVFFMAIDGCAPRAKMNQQRSRRFRTAKDAHDAREKAIKSGQELPKEDPFDTNCITPGTVFMAKLSRQLQYFINKKVSEDAAWSGVRVIFSGHDVPGEGEHKIMEFIRTAKAQPGYDPNVRECLYGLDADLIMLGLLSHEPHFCLLREEVTFGPVKAGAKTKELTDQNFYLMQLSLLREYLELEFLELKDKLPFPYDIERIIDDFILMAFFIGNDFLPNLPNLHINEGALVLMYKVYKETLPLCGGYLNDNGVINQERLCQMLEGLEKFEREYFEAESHDINHFASRETNHLDNIESAKEKNRLMLTRSQSKLIQQIKGLVKQGSGSINVKTEGDAELGQFIDRVAGELSLTRKTVATEEDGAIAMMTRLQLNDTASAQDKTAVQRALTKYSKAPVVETTLAEAEAAMHAEYERKFNAWKAEYYKEKLGFAADDDAALTKMTTNYCEGLQWVLYYYYHGVVSWGWYYAYHYSPKISDVRKGLQSGAFKFDIGKPFKPFEQLMGVLPERSKKLVPECFRELMVEDDSPIKDFYPNDFPLDMNGKKADWEAVVKIPFIDEARLLGAMQSRSARLTDDERARNTHGPAIEFVKDPAVDTLSPSSLPGFFPDFRSHCRMSVFELPALGDVNDLTKGLTDGVLLGVDALAGFPTLYTLPFKGKLELHGVNVFMRDSKQDSMVIHLGNAHAGRKSEDVAREFVGRQVYVNWPYLQEAKVLAVSDSHFRYEMHGSRLVPVPHRQGPEMWSRQAKRVAERYSRKLAVVTGEVTLLVHVAPLRGLKRTDEGAFVKDFAAEDGTEQEFALQTVVADVNSHDARFEERAAVDVAEEFPIGCKVFFLGTFNYGRPARVMGHTDGKMDIVLSVLKMKEVDFGRQLAQKALTKDKYYPAPVVSKVVGMSALALSKLTSSFSVVLAEDRLNLGLNLKFEGKRQKVLGYSRRSQMGWEFSDKAVALLQAYKKQFPAFIAGLERLARKENVRAEEFFNDPAEAKAQMKEIRDWLKRHEVKSFERVPLEAQELDAETIAQIEQAANKANTSAATEAVGKTVKGVPRTALLRPQDAIHRLGDQTFALGDRVVFVAETGKVPITTRGTCVGVHKDSLDVVFDAAFMSGTVLGGRCSEYRGMTVEYASVLNVSQPSVLAVSKAQATRQPAVQSRTVPSTTAGSQRQSAAHPARSTQPVKLLARNAPVPGQQYYAGPPARVNNVWQGRSDSQFLGSMLQQGGAVPVLPNANWQQQQQMMHTGPPATATAAASHGGGGGGGGSGRARGKGRGRGRGGQPGQAAQQA